MASRWLKASDMNSLVRSMTRYLCRRISTVGDGSNCFDRRQAQKQETRPKSGFRFSGSARFFGCSGFFEHLGERAFTFDLLDHILKVQAADQGLLHLPGITQL